MFTADTDFNKKSVATLAEDVRQELDSIQAQQTEWEQVEHDQDGHHTDMTATSIVVDDAGEFGGNVTVQANTTNESIVGVIPAAAPYRGVSGLDLQAGVNRWVVGADSSAVATQHGFFLQDRQQAGIAYTLRIAWDSVNSKYILSPEVTYPIDLGLAASGERFTDVHIGGHIKQLGYLAGYGAWTDVTFAAGNFTASAGTWTLTSGDQILFRYMIIDKSLWMNFELRTTSTSAGMTTELRIALPQSLTVAQSGRQMIQVSDNGAAFQVGMAVWGAAATYVRCYVDPTGATNWTSGAVDTTAVIGTIGPIETT